MDLYGELFENVNLKDYNTYKIGGSAKYLIKPNNIEGLKNLINYLNKNSIKYFILGKGSNVILPDSDYNGAVILLDKLNNITFFDNYVEVESGCVLNILINSLVNKSFKGLENLYGIPGTVGGAIVQNAGCYGSSISDYLISVKYLEGNEIKEIKRDECSFSYRNSLFKNDKDKIIISCKIKLDSGNKEELLKVIKCNMLKRKNSQPLEYPNAGSVFKNPINCYAAKLIDDNDLKGYTIGGATISNKHANFIINKNNATSKDIIDLINYIKKIVYLNNKIELILEQEIVKY